MLCDFQVWREKPHLKHRLRGRRTATLSTDSSLGCLVVWPQACCVASLATGQLHAWSKITRRALWVDAFDSLGAAILKTWQPCPLALDPRQQQHYMPQTWVAYRQRGGSILATMTLAKAFDQSAALLTLHQALAGRSELADAGLHLPWPTNARAICTEPCVLFKNAEASSAELDVAAQRLRGDFASASPLTAGALLRAYVQQRGWLVSLV